MGLWYVSRGERESGLHFEYCVGRRDNIMSTDIIFRVAGRWEAGKHHAAAAALRLGFIGGAAGDSGSGFKLMNTSIQTAEFKYCINSDRRKIRTPRSSWLKQKIKNRILKMQ